ncbi:MAG TPA: hypothetical protein VM571_00625 [Noviherbaspirillum sp.]|nr:hypothetical protein [Noviherbaspirillum sp.]
MEMSSAGNFITDLTGIDIDQQKPRNGLMHYRLSCMSPDMRERVSCCLA